MVVYFMSLFCYNCYAAFVCMFLAAYLEKVSESIRGGVDAFILAMYTILSGDGRGLASACEDRVGGWVCLIEESWLCSKNGRRGSDKYAPPKTLCQTSDRTR